MPGVPLRLIVGLGNPGPEYARTRHNAGFHLVDELARRQGAVFRQEDIAKVMTSESGWQPGGPVRSVASFDKIAPDSILVADDELDFAPGVVRLKQGGGAAGHNGLRDVIAQIGDPFWRLRIGIGHPGDRSEVLNYVLGRPGSEEARLIDSAILAALDVVPVIVSEGGQKAMNRLHGRDAPSGDLFPPQT